MLVLLDHLIHDHCIEIISDVMASTFTHVFSIVDYILGDPRSCIPPTPASLKDYG